MKRHFLPNETVFSLGQNYTFYRTKQKNLPDELFLLEGFSLFSVYQKLYPTRIPKIG